MSSERLRALFAHYLLKQKLNTLLTWDSALTISQDRLLKYERVDKYKVLFLDYRELKKLMQFCENHGIGLWFGADKLCIGFHYRGCQKLSAYSTIMDEVI